MHEILLKKICSEVVTKHPDLIQKLSHEKIFPAFFDFVKSYYVIDEENDGYQSLIPSPTLQ